MKKVSFSITVYDGNYQNVLLSGFLEEQLKILNYDFYENIITINDISDKEYVVKIIKEKFPSFRILSTDEKTSEVLGAFNQTRQSLNPGYFYSNHLFYNLYYSKSRYLFHISSDCPLIKFDSSFFEESIDIMMKHRNIISAMPSWDETFIAPKEESVEEIGNFYKAKGFTDQICLYKKSVFMKDIYNYKHPLSANFPEYGENSFERKVHSFMYCCDKYRIIHKNSCYKHQRA